MSTSFSLVREEPAEPPSDGLSPASLIITFLPLVVLVPALIFVVRYVRRYDAYMRRYEEHLQRQREHMERMEAKTDRLVALLEANRDERPRPEE